MNAKHINLAFFIVLLFSSKILVAQWVTDPYLNNPLCLASGNQMFPKIATDSKGGAYIIWEDYRNGTSKIFVQRIDKNGTTKWTNNGLQLSEINSRQLLQIL